MSTTLACKPGVHFAEVDGQGVLMDLFADRYLGLSRWGSRIWDALARGEPTDTIAEALVGEEGLSEAEAHDLVHRQIEAWKQYHLLLPPQQARAKLALPQSRARVEPSAAVEPEVVAGTRFSALGFLHLVWAGLWTRAALRWRGLPWTLGRVQRIRARALSARRREWLIRRTLKAYVALRRPVSQGQRDCLPRSVGLAAALRRQGLDATVCFGVRNYPFLAHAWVEADGVAINEPLDTVCRFTALACF
jgi:hypothetical protein